MATVTHTGGCHCGKVSFEVEAPTEIDAYECNCSICRCTAYLHLIVPAASFRLLTGESDLVSYRFNTGVAKHYFCRACGIKSFYVPRSHPDGFSVNVRCLDTARIESVNVISFDGANWEKNSGQLAPLPAAGKRSSNRADAVPLAIRGAELADAARIAEIYNEAILTTTATFDLEPKTVAERRGWLGEHGDRFPVLVGEVKDTVVAFASLSPWSDRGAYADTAETGLYVHSGHRGQGIGRRLYLAIIEEAKRLGFHTLIARVTEDSEVSIHLNKAFGFVVVGTMQQVGRKFGRLLDVLIMQKMLT